MTSAAQGPSRIVLPFAGSSVPSSPSAAGYRASEGGQTGTTLSGTITQTENGQPLAGALVVIDELRREVRAGDDGSYRFENVPPGQYHVGVRAEGYSTRRTEVTVGTDAGDAEHLDRFRSALRGSAVGQPNARPQFESYQPTSVLSGRS